MVFVRTLLWCVEGAVEPVADRAMAWHSFPAVFPTDQSGGQVLDSSYS